MPARSPERLPRSPERLALHTLLVTATAAALLVLLTPQPAAAQARATLRGTLRNAAGAPQPNVTINVVNLDTENERQVITEADGTWTMGGLLPGR